MPALTPGTFLPAAPTIQRTLKATCSSLHTEGWSHHNYYSTTESNSACGKGDNTYSGISYNNNSSMGRVVAEAAGKARELGAGRVIYSGHLRNL